MVGSSLSPLSEANYSRLFTQALRTPILPLLASQSAGVAVSYKSEKLSSVSSFSSSVQEVVQKCIPPSRSFGDDMSTTINGTVVNVQELVDLIAGPLSLGSYLATVFWTCAVVLIFHYVTRFWYSDHWLLRYSVVFVAVTSTFLMITEILIVYKYTISFWGNFNYLTSQDKSLPRYEILVGVLGTVVQTYLVSRYYRLSRNIFITIFLGLCILLSFASCVTLTIFNFRFDLIHDRNKLTTIVIIFLSSSSGTDVLIAAFLTASLLRWRKRTSNLGTKSVIADLIITTVETGTFTSLWALAVLFAFLSKKESNIAPGIAFPLGHGYVLTMMFNLLLRNGPKSPTLLTRDNVETRNITEKSINSTTRMRRQGTEGSMTSLMLQKIPLQSPVQEGTQVEMRNIADQPRLPQFVIASPPVTGARSGHQKAESMKVSFTMPQNGDIEPLRPSTSSPLAKVIRGEAKESPMVSQNGPDFVEHSAPEATWKPWKPVAATAHAFHPAAAPFHSSIIIARPGAPAPSAPQSKPIFGSSTASSRQVPSPPLPQRRPSFDSPAPASRQTPSPALPRIAEFTRLRSGSANSERSTAVDSWRARQSPITQNVTAIRGTTSMDGPRPNVYRPRRPSADSLQSSSVISMSSTPPLQVRDRHTPTPTDPRPAFTHVRSNSTNSRPYGFV
ncbi:hypothetical protein BT69DRAFT_1354704 [Atractiella rhizophila]|nr:hypothetical protein BT69DRAFT_1354704 [Atractiella rhizophila]